MNWLVDRFLRIDARSAGVFRIVFGLTLIADLLHRWDWVRAFYSNEGVLPNHNHLFQLREAGAEKAWSIYHSFSNPDEANVAFMVTFVLYLLFTLGFFTRAMHIASLVCLVSLCGRNILLDTPGNSLAIGLLFMSLALPLGQRCSIDSLRKGFDEVDEKGARQLNDRSRPRTPMAPASLASLLLIVFIGFVLLAAALQQKGATWQSGDALYYALHTDRWTGRLGVEIRESIGLLRGWTKTLRIAEFAVLPLALIPVARIWTRPLAMGLLAFIGLTYGLFFTLGLYGWSLIAAAALLIPQESWDALSWNRPVDLVYDTNCGICLWCARLLKRLDIRGNVTFVGNDEVVEGSEGYRDEKLAGYQLPDGVAAEVVHESMVVVRDGEAFTDARALSELLRSLTVLAPLGWLIRIPGLSHIAKRLYYRVADNRIDMSVALGLGACGIPSAGGVEDASDEEETPGRIWFRRGGAVLSSALALLVMALVLAATDKADALPKSGLGNTAALVRASQWARIKAGWGMFAPDPPRTNGSLVIDAQTRTGWQVDVLTGYPPDLELVEPRRHRKGVLWAAYQDNIHQENRRPYRKELRRYLSRGGYAVDVRKRGMYIARLKAYWVTAEIPAPGEARGKVERLELFTTRGRGRGLQRRLGSFPKLPKK